MSLILSGTDGVSDIDGTAATPAIRGTDANTGIFFPTADTIAFTEGGVESMRINSSGNVGIGTTTVASGYRTQINGSLYISQGNGNIKLDNNDGNSGTLQITGSDLRIGTDSNIPMWFYTNGNERMRITSAGNVGIGTSSPAFPLDVRAATSVISAVSTTGTNSAYMYVSNTGGDFYLGRDNSTGATFGTGTGYSAVLYSAGAYPMAFFTNATERMRIDSSGNLLVGTTATQNISGINTDHTFIGTTNTNRWVSGFINNSASSPYGLAVNYTGSAPNATGNQSIFFTDTGGTRFEVRSNGGIANYSGNNVNLSDAREKTNIELAGSYLNKICSIPVKTFNYIDQNLEEDDGLTLGVIAQDVQAVAPELVMESNWAGKDQPEKMRLSIYQTDLQYALMKSIQELKAELDIVKAELQTLKGN